MNKKEFLDKLRKETSNERLVSQYDEFIDDRVADGESEEGVVASYNLKQIVRMHELEQREKRGQFAIVQDDSMDSADSMDSTDSMAAAKKPVNSDNPILCLVLSLVGLAVSIACLALIGYFVAEIIEVASGYYDHRGAAYVRSEIIGYSVGLGFSVLGFVAGLILGIVSFKKYRRVRAK